MESAAIATGNASDSAILDTTRVCADADDWITALKKEPAAGSLTSYTTDDAKQFLNVVCIHSIKSKVCIDAEKRGYLTFKLDDHRVLDLNKD